MSMEHDFSSGSPLKVTCNNTSTALVAANENRKYLVIVNDSDEVIYLSLGSAAVMNQGIRVNPNGGSYEISGNKPFRQVVYGICSSGSKNVSYFEA